MLVLNKLKFIFLLFFFQLLKQLRLSYFVSFLTPFLFFFLVFIIIFIFLGWINSSQLFNSGGILLQFLLGLRIFLFYVFKFFGLVFNLLLHCNDMSFLVIAVLRVVWSTHKKLKCYRVVLVIQVPFSVE